MIRIAKKIDHNPIAHLQISSWRLAYADMLPPDYLGKPVYDDLMGRWTDHTPGENDVLLVHQGENGIDGFINVLGNDPAYVDNLHVSPRAYNSGIGSALMRAAAAQLIKNGQSSVWLTVITSNTPAIQFYLGLGAERGVEKQELLYGQPVTSVEMIWRDLPGLARQV